MRWFVYGVLGLLLVFETVKGDTRNEISEDRYILKNACIDLLRNQVNAEMHASLVYMNMAAYFNRNCIARRGFAKFFEENSKEERHHAQKFIDFLNLRGNYFTKFDIKMPTATVWPSALDAIKDAIRLEKDVNNMINTLHDVAETQCQDAHLMDFIEREFLEEQVKSIDTLLRFEAVLTPMKDDLLSEYLFDKQLLGEKYELYETGL